MPAKVRKINNRWRVVDSKGLLRNRAKTPVDGGGHKTKEKAERQARAINANS